MTIRMESYLPQAKAQQENTKDIIRFELKKMIDDDVPQIKEFDIRPFQVSYGRALLRYQIYKVASKYGVQKREQVASLFQIHKYGDKFFVSYCGRH